MQREKERRAQAGGVCQTAMFCPGDRYHSWNAQNGLLTHLHINSFIQQLTTGASFGPGSVVSAEYAVVSRTGMVPAFLELTVGNYAAQYGGHSPWVAT